MVDRGERVHLPGGGEVLVRPLEPGDREALRQGFERLGDRSRYLRFMAPKSMLTETELTFLTDVDHVDHEALGAIDVATGEGVGVARYIRGRERPEAAEAAVAVVDDWQGRGLGSLLLERLVARAEANGVSHFSAALLATNHAVRRLFERVGRVTVVRQGEGALEVDVELPLAGDAPKVALREAARRCARHGMSHGAHRPPGAGR